MGNCRYSCSIRAIYVADDFLHTAGTLKFFHVSDEVDFSNVIHNDLYALEEMEFEDFDGQKHYVNLRGMSSSFAETEFHRLVQDNLKKCHPEGIADGSGTSMPRRSGPPGPDPMAGLLKLFGGALWDDKAGASPPSKPSEPPSPLEFVLGNIWLWVVNLFIPSLGLKVTIYAWRVCLEESGGLAKVFFRFPIAVFCTPFGIVSTVALVHFCLAFGVVLFEKTVSPLLRIAVCALLGAATGYWFLRLGFLEDLPWAAQHLGSLIAGIWHLLLAFLGWVWHLVF